MTRPVPTRLRETEKTTPVPMSKPVLMRGRSSVARATEGRATGAPTIGELMLEPGRLARGFPLPEGSPPLGLAAPGSPLGDWESVGLGVAVGAEGEMGGTTPLGDDGAALGEAFALGVSVGEGSALSEGLALCEGLAVGLSLGVGEGSSVGEAVDVGEGLGSVVPVGSLDGLGVSVGFEGVVSVGDGVG